MHQSVVRMMKVLMRQPKAQHFVLLQLSKLAVIVLRVVVAESKALAAHRAGVVHMVNNLIRHRRETK